MNFLFSKKCPSYYFNKCITIHLTWKFPVWVIKGARLLLLSIKTFLAKFGKNYRMIYLSWKFPFCVFKRCSFQVWVLFLLSTTVKAFVHIDFTYKELMKSKKTELLNSEILYLKKFPSYVTRFFYFHFFTKVSNIGKLSCEITI